MWFILALLTAIATSSTDAWAKKFFSPLGLRCMAISPIIYSLPLLIITLLIIPKPELDKRFYVALLCGLPINVLSYFLYMKAIIVSPLSLSLPFLALTPVFMIITGYFILNEVPNLMGVMGIIVVVMGAYVLNVTPETKDFLLPFKRFFREKGSVLMALVSLLFSFGAVLGKLGIMASNPLFFGCSFFIVQNSLILLFTTKSLRRFAHISQLHPKLLLVGILYYLHIFLHNY
ncbi:MAG: EamA family transporter, partial [Desulfatiglandales bacterium]